MIKNFKNLSILLSLSLLGCGKISTTILPVTIPAPLSYLAQSVNPDGNINTPLGFSSSWTYERFDYNNNQAEQTFLNNNGVDAETIWSYSPFGKFNALNGDGGETYVNIGGAYYITSTQDGGKPGIQIFPSQVWWLFDNHVPDCSVGWEMAPNGLGRACHEVVSFPAYGVSGNQITGDAILSEHYNKVNLQGNMERSYFVQGWGRLDWQSWQQNCNVRVNSDLIPISSFNKLPKENPNYIKCDERLITNIYIPPDINLSGKDFGWP